MEELLIQAEPQILQKFKTVAQERYRGNDAIAFREAVLALISSEQKRDTTRLEAIINKIRADIESAGGLTAKQIDKLVSDSRRRRKTTSA